MISPVCLPVETEGKQGEKGQRRFAEKNFALRAPGTKRPKTWAKSFGPDLRKARHTPLALHRASVVSRRCQLPTILNAAGTKMLVEVSAFVG